VVGGPFFPWSTAFPLPPVEEASSPWLPTYLSILEPISSCKWIPATLFFFSLGHLGSAGFFFSPHSWPAPFPPPLGGHRGFSPQAFPWLGSVCVNTLEWEEIIVADLSPFSSDGELIPLPFGCPSLSGPRRETSFLRTARRHRGFSSSFFSSCPIESLFPFYAAVVKDLTPPFLTSPGRPFFFPLEASWAISRRTFFHAGIDFPQVGGNFPSLQTSGERIWFFVIRCAWDLLFTSASECESFFQAVPSLYTLVHGTPFPFWKRWIPASTGNFSPPRKQSY